MLGFINGRDADIAPLIVATACPSVALTNECYAQLKEDSSAVLRSGAVELLVMSNPAYDWVDEQFRSVGMEPDTAKFIVVKNSMNFRVGYRDLAKGGIHLGHARYHSCDTQGSVVQESPTQCEFLQLRLRLPSTETAGQWSNASGYKN